jgi:hypothetical protein
MTWLAEYRYVARTPVGGAQAQARLSDASLAFADSGKDRRHAVSSLAVDTRLLFIGGLFG